MYGIVHRLLKESKKLLYIVPLLLILPVVVYALSDDSGRENITSWMMQTPARSLISRGYDYYPAFLNKSDVVIYQKTFTDENGNDYNGAVIEIRKPTAFATPANTGSMQPVFGSGNILVQEIVTSKTELHVGDMVVYSNNEDLVIHQIVDETGQCYVTKGLNNAAPDPICVTKDMVKYRLLFSVPTKG